jgi:hypothetical protein
VRRYSSDGPVKDSPRCTSPIGRLPSGNVKRARPNVPPNLLPVLRALVLDRGHPSGKCQGVAPRTFAHAHTVLLEYRDRRAVLTVRVGATRAIDRDVGRFARDRVGERILPGAWYPKSRSDAFSVEPSRIASACFLPVAEARELIALGAVFKDHPSLAP